MAMEGKFKIYSGRQRLHWGIRVRMGQGPYCRMDHFHALNASAPVSLVQEGIIGENWV